MAIYQTNSLPLPLETFTQPCAELGQRNNLRDFIFKHII